MTTIRDETSILNDLKKLCISPGYIHVIACICFEETTIPCKNQQISINDLQHHFLNYLNSRAEVSKKIICSDEISIFASYLKFNTLVNQKPNFNLYFGEGVRAEIDIAMLVRRRNMKGEATPEGFLTLIEKLSLKNIIKKFEQDEDPDAIDFGSMLLTFTTDELRRISDAINETINKAKIKKQFSDFSMFFIGIDIGLTIHCNNEEKSKAYRKLYEHFSK